MVYGAMFVLYRHKRQGYVNAPHCYVVRMLRVLLLAYINLLNAKLNPSCKSQLAEFF